MSRFLVSIAQRVIEVCVWILVVAGVVGGAGLLLIGPFSGLANREGMPGGLALLQGLVFGIVGGIAWLLVCLFWATVLAWISVVVQAVLGAAENLESLVEIAGKGEAEKKARARLANERETVSRANEQYDRSRAAAAAGGARPAAPPPPPPRGDFDAAIAADLAAESASRQAPRRPQ